MAEAENYSRGETGERQKNEKNKEQRKKDENARKVERGFRAMKKSRDGKWSRRK
jgi:hypothetical protein